MNTSTDTGEVASSKPWERDPIVHLVEPKQNISLGLQGELGFDGPNPFGERALDIYGQAIGQIESGNRYEITGGYNNHYQGRYCLTSAPAGQI